MKHSTNLPGAVARTLSVLMVLIFLLLFSLHWYTGYADNGDFVRSAGFMLEKPAGFSEMWPAAGSDESQHRFFHYWLNDWVFLASWPDFSRLFSYSSYKVYLALQAWLGELFSADHHQYSLQAGSLWSRAILLTGFAGMLSIVRKRLPVQLVWLFTVTAAFVILDSNWIAFLNSLYEEQIAVIFLPLMAFCLLKYFEHRTTVWRFALLLCAAWIGSAKTAYFYLPLLLACFIVPPLKQRLALALFAVFVLVSQACAVMPVYLGKYQKINAYHAVYFGALNVSPMARSIEQIGNKPVLKECVGQHGFSELGQACIEKAGASHADVLKLVMAHPSIGVSLISRVMFEGCNIRLDYLGKQREGQSAYADLTIFNIETKLFSYGYNFLMLLAGVAVAGCLLFRKKASPISDSLLGSGLFFIVFGFSQYAVALADGFFEITKHLIIGNYCLAFSLPFVLCGLISYFKREAQLQSTAVPGKV